MNLLRMIQTNIAFTAGFEAGDDFIANSQRFARVVFRYIFAKLYNGAGALWPK